MAMVLLLGSYQVVWAQETETPEEGTTEKVMHPVYINEQGSMTIDAPSEVADGETLNFKLGAGAGHISVTQNGAWCSIEGMNKDYFVSNVKGPILICARSEEYYTTEDGNFYVVANTREALYNWELESSLQPSSSVELKNMVEINGVNYSVRNYVGWGCFNEYENVTSLTFPNTFMYFSPNSIDKQVGLKEIHAKALDPTEYKGIEEAFGEKDLSEVTLYVPRGYVQVYESSAPWNRFKEIVEEGEVPTDFPVYLQHNPGIVDYSPKTVKKGESYSLSFTLENGYYSPYQSPYTRRSEEVDCDQIIDLKTTNKKYTQNGLSYALYECDAEAYLYDVNLPSGVDELEIPVYITSGKSSYLVRIPEKVTGDLSRIKKMTIKGSMVNMAFRKGVFEDCTALEEIHCEGENTSAHRVEYGAFSDKILNTCIVYVPKGCVDAYKDSGWRMFTNIVEEGTVVNTNSVRVVHNPFDSSYLQARGLDTNPSETAFIYQSEEGAEADVLMRYTIRNYDQWKGHVAISYWEDMSTYGSGQNWIQADISPEGVFEIKVSKDYIADNGQDMFYNNLRVYADQTGELLYDIQAYTNEQLALEAKDNVMTFINPISFTCGLDTIKGTVGKKIQVPITVGEVSSDLAGKEFRIDGDFWLPVDGEGKFHVYKPDGGEVNLVQTGAAGDPAQCIIMSDKDGILMGRLESNQTYTLTLVSDMEISDFHFNMISFQPMADGKDINGTNWTSPYIIDSTKMIEADSTVTDIEVGTITIKAETETQITVNFEGVTSGELIVSSETNVNLNLSGDNNLGDVTNNGTLTIQTSTDVTLNATITNNGTLIDETGLITDVAGSAALNIGQMADAEVEDGGTVTLTASANIEIGVTITFQWQRLLNGVWTNVEENGTNARLLRSTSETSTLEVASADAGEYRCLITSAAPVGDTETRAASTTLAAYATVTVTEPVEPEPEPEPAYYTVTLPVVEGATIEAVGSTSVKEGESFSFTVTLKDGYVAADMVVKANSVTLTPDASGRYTIANVRSDVVITVTGIEPDPAVGVEDVETSGLKVWSAAGNLHIQTPEADRAYIVTFGGRVYKIHELPAGETAIPMPQGAYIIYVGGESFKISM